MQSEAVSSAERSALHARYNSLISGLELLNVRLAEASVAAPSIYVPDAERKLEADISTESNYFGIDAGFVVNAILTFEARYPDEEASQLTVKVELELVYSSNDPMDDDLFEEFDRSNLPLNTWPYFREFLHSSLSRAGWPIYTLPAYKSGGGRRPLDPPSMPEEERVN